MNFLRPVECFRLFSLLLLFSACAQPESEYYALEDFEGLKKIDAHVHLRKDADTVFVEQAKADNFYLMTISVDSPGSMSLEEQEEFALRMIERFPGRITYASAFTVNNWDDENWQQETLRYLEQSINKGAIGIKVWKNIGMTLKGKDGKFVLIDHPRFDTVLDFLAKKHIPVIAHLGEHRNSWLPLEEMTVKGNRDYARDHPQYHMYLHPEYPSYWEHIEAKSRMLKKHPDLVFIGAHLAQLEWSVDELAKRLDSFPNMAVDLAERISHLQYQTLTQRDKVRDFFIKYQDRLLYATDLRASASDIVQANLTTPEEIRSHAHNVWFRHWKFLVTDETMQVPKVSGEFQGLKLPRKVVDKIYWENARKWIPGIVKE